MDIRVHYGFVPYGTASVVIGAAGNSDMVVANEIVSNFSPVGGVVMCCFSTFVMDASRAYNVVTIIYCVA